jgi:two-component system sensor histidine kinase DesK
VSGWRRVVLAAGMLVYPGIAFATVPSYAAGTVAVIGYLLVAAYCLCYFLLAFAFARAALRSFWVLLGAMTILFVAVTPIIRVNAFFLAAVILAVASIRVRRRVFPFVAVAIVAAIVLPLVVPAWHTGAGWTQAVMILFTVLITYAFSEIATTNQRLLESRVEIARLAAEAERNRIARDLHDLVGHSLTAITVKSNLARQLAVGSPALSEITEVEALSRQALADVRAAVSGYTEVTLAGELARGRELLRAAGVDADLPTATEPVDATHQELFGWAVREGITNVVRHANAKHCTVTITPTGIAIRDDGRGTMAQPGNGIAGLRDRVESAGGHLETGPVSPHGWHLAVSLP